MNQTNRKAEFAGSFYPSSIFEIEKLIDQILLSEKDKINNSLADKNLIGAVVPHAAYIYSGYQAVHVYEILKRSKTIFDTFIIVNPNHTGLGTNEVNLSKAAFWESPQGDVAVDIEFAQAMEIEFNDSAHQREHSGEVQLPLLKHFIPYNFKIVMLTMNIQTPTIAQKLAKSIQKAIEKTNRKVFLLASSDFSHFETAELGYCKDQHIIDEIFKLNSNELFRKVRKHNISACGYGPIMTLVEFLKLISKKPEIELLKRGHSGEIHPSQKVVNYASLLCFE